MDYFRVNITGTDAVYEEVDNSGNSRFTDANGVTVPVEQERPIYNERSWVITRLPWMEPIPLPYYSTKLSSLQFLELFTVSERIAIRQASKSSVIIEDWLELLNATSEIDLSHQELVDSLNGLATFGLLQQARVNMILQGIPPNA